MPIPPYAAWMLEQEARALLTRLARVKPFALQESMLPAANLLPGSQLAIEKFLMAGRRHLRGLVRRFLRWLRSPARQWSDAEQAQRQFTILRLRFNAVVTHFDMFDNVITQRSESDTGLWLSGLDVVSADALQLKQNYYEAPPVICYLDRGVGAAIRRARTRMPGGGDNPVAIIKVPRERMIGSGIASSLVHEVGHQAAALLELLESLRPVLDRLGRGSVADQDAWRLWKRWISEIVADFWSIARVGIASTLGLMGVVSLPRAFVFRLNADDPHPTPWIRVKLSAALGQALYPQPAWDQLAQLWEAYYPLTRLEETHQRLLRMLERTIPALVAVLVNHRPVALRGRSLVEALDLAERQPSRLRDLLDRWRNQPREMYETAPTVVFAVIGQGRVDGKITPEEESVVVGKLLGHWALQSTLQAAANCVPPVHQCACRAAAA
ncbi:MAG TPA: hypothetical protein VFF64_16200 [Candidatus Eremiobacteraceae bacterium]|nr:hypothetical protein [Candidatus Eremiobacteraceae bacterium]